MNNSKPKYEYKFPFRYEYKIVRVDGEHTYTSTSYFDCTSYWLIMFFHGEKFFDECLTEFITKSDRIIRNSKRLLDEN